MGIYVNPGNEEFKRAVNSKIYVDKTMLLAYTNQNLNTEHQNICVSRPRRFGKSMAANMLVAYYGKGDDSYELFQPFKIAKDPSFQEHLNQYNAIHLNMQQFLGRAESIDEMIELISRKVVRELKREFPQVTYYEEDLVSILEEIYSQTRSYFVFVIDEWDCRCSSKRRSWQCGQSAKSIAQASEFVDGLEDGCDAYVAQGGANFSGGQKQRLVSERSGMPTASLCWRTEKSPEWDGMRN